MKNSPRHSAFSSAFTLIELLTVITIIAILMAMLFPFINGAMEHTRNKKADADARTISQAVAQYNVEYGQYPRFTESEDFSKDNAVGDPASGATVSNANLFNVLRDIDAEPNTGHVQNPRRQSYMETRVVSNLAHPRDGFLDGSAAGNGQGVRGALYDPWGSQYGVVIDSNSDNQLDVSAFYTDFQGLDAPRVNVGVFSLGKDKTLGKGNDKRYRTSAADVSDDHVSWTNR